MAFLGLDEAKDVYSAAMDSERFWGNRNLRITKFRNLVRQIDLTQAGKSKKYHTFEGNESGSFFSVMVQLLSRNEPQHRIPLSTDDEATRITKGQIERLVAGTYRDVDYQRSLRMDGEPLQTTLSKFICSDGWAIAEVVKRETDEDEDEGEPLVDIRTYDSMDVYPQWGPDGLVVVIIHTERTQLDVSLEYPNIALAKQYNIKTGKHHEWRGNDRSVDVYTCYYRKGKDVYYGVTANGDWAIKPRKIEWTKRIPVVVMPVNGLPFRSNKKQVNVGESIPNSDIANFIGYRDDWTVDVGRGIFHMNEELYPAFNELWARVMDFIAKEAGSTYYKKTEGGDDDEMAIGRGTDAINALGLEDEIGRIASGSLANELTLALAQMSQMLQRGGISHQLTGQIPPGDLSGFAINQLISAAVTVATPYLQGIVAIYRQLDQLILQVYRSSGRKAQTVNVWREKSFVEERVDLSVLQDKSYFFDIKLKAGLPEDLASRVNVAALAKTNELLDDWTILDEVLSVDDPELILTRLDEKAVLNLPTIRLRRMAAMMLQRGDIASAAAILQELMLLQGQSQVNQSAIDMQLQQLQGLLQGGQPGGPQGQVPGPAQAAEPMMAAAGQEGGGLPPEILPPEMTGVPPAEVRAF